MTKVAFCDDELSMLNELQVLLDGYRVKQNQEIEYTAFRSPLELLAVIERGIRFDVLLLDVLMPGENGIDTAAEIRHYDSNVKIIFLTSSAEFAVQSLLLLRFAAPAVRQLSDSPAHTQLKFGVIPALYYGFDYLTSVYTNLLQSGNPAAVEFMPFVCCMAYLVFILYHSTKKQMEIQLQQIQKSLDIQLSQAVREIDVLRESQAMASRYRHDMRHHLQYLATCLENGQTEQAQDYIFGICEEINAQNVRRYCENEAANLILSSFAGRAERAGISMNVQGTLPAFILVSDNDLCVLLSNALENAINACQPMVVAGTPCDIDVQVYDRNGKLFLQVTNPYRNTVRFEHGVPVSDRPGHGIGVQSICAIVERYGGIYAFSVQDGRFVLRLSL